MNSKVQIFNLLASLSYPNKSRWKSIFGLKKNLIVVNHESLLILDNIESANQFALFLLKESEKSIHDPELLFDIKVLKESMVFWFQDFLAQLLDTFTIESFSADIESLMEKIFLNDKQKHLDILCEFIILNLNALQSVSTSYQKEFN